MGCMVCMAIINGTCALKRGLLPRRRGERGVRKRKGNGDLISTMYFSLSGREWVLTYYVELYFVVVIFFRSRYLIPSSQPSNLEFYFSVHPCFAGFRCLKAGRRGAMHSYRIEDNVS
ncbi:hypothetical protein F5Y07DRAFT_63242 [Xylaria sp. FL0933]|nr:hypothetical protein F5Y07DRAFT_63242 [Xylaria sp. FL0933]